MPLTESAHVPTSTYRLQLHEKFTFDDAARLLGYFRQLGLGDLYLSPIFTATPGSQHGYDVTDYGTVSPEIGGREGFERLTDQLRAAGMAALVDFVPNHMGIAGARNAWWRDVLERGRQSGYADFFDIQWRAEREENRPRVLVPMLADHYGKELEQGKISVRYDDEFSIFYSDVSLPMSPRSYATVLSPLISDSALAEADRRQLAALGLEFSAEPARADATPADKKAYAVRIASAKTALRRLVAERPVVADRLAARLRTLNGVPGEPGSFALLHDLINEQHYRLARWKTGAHEINYRRFFAIDTLIGLRVERAEVFRAAHALLAELVAAGRVGGLRIDHIDGLRDPLQYLRSLQSLARDQPERPLYVLVEKILGQGEYLPAGWPVHGTTGYEFITQLAGIFVDATSRRQFDAIYRDFTGDTRAYPDLVYEKKRMIISEMFADAVNNLGAQLTQIVGDDWRWQDLTRHELTTAVSEFIANLSVYRTYRQDEGRVSAQDQRVLEAACAATIARNPLADPQPIEFLCRLLIGVYPSPDAPPEYRRALLEWVLTFQQYTGAVMAKSVEDTAYYNYSRLIALNEVGGAPELFGSTVEAFHEANRVRQEQTPHALLTTSTHDTKLSEDVRARLYALSEIPGEWSGWLDLWHEHNAVHLSKVDGAEAPDRLDEYRFYQVMLGVWPLDESEVNDDAFRARLQQHFRKAVDEAKRRTSMLHPNEAYLKACDRFVAALLAHTGEADEFGVNFRRAAQRIARLGMVNSLAQTILKCTVPGVPDFYQGNEVWDFSLVDPDNRRPVDYARREALLSRLSARTPADLLEHWRDGGLKLHAAQRLLRFRAEYPALFARGRYTPAITSGAFAARCVAFTREHDGRTLLVVVPRLFAKLGAPPLGAVWDDTRVAAPASRGWRDLFTGRNFPAENELPLRTLFAELPFAALENL